MTRRALAALLVAATLMAAGPARAESAPTEPAARLVANLLDRHMIEPGETLWLAPAPLRWDAEEVAFLDGLSAAFLARKVNVVRDPLGLPSSAETDLVRAQASFRLAGVSRVLSYTLGSGANRVAIRLIDPLSGQVRTVETLSLAGAPAAMGTATEQPSLFSLARLPDESRALGACYSSLSGSGLTYRHWLANGWGFQVAGIPFVTLNGAQSSGFVNLGMQGMMPIVRTERIRMFGLFGAGAAYNVTNYPGMFPANSKLDLDLAPGLGMDLMLLSNLALTGSLGYSVSRTTTDGANETWGLNPGVSIGALLYW